MARLARILSETGIYHIIFRGVNRYNIFEEEKDYKKILEIIFDLKENMKFEIYAYCLMTNHVHLIIKEKTPGEISVIMKRMLTRYAGWFNKKYYRSGILIANRFKSEPVETDDYLITLSRYIHQNPVKGGLSPSVDKYNWSSFKEYSGNSYIVDTNFILSIVDYESYKKYNFELDDEEYEINSNADKITDENVKMKIKELLCGKDPFILGELPKEERNKIIIQLKNIEKFSIRQIERATGISKGVIERCK